MTLRSAANLYQYRGNVLVTAPASEPVTLAELKLALRIDGTDDDTFLNSAITEARQEIEDVTGLALITQEWALSLDSWPHEDTPWWDGVRQMAVSELSAQSGQAWVSVSRYPLQSVEVVTVYDNAGAGVAVSIADVFDIDTYQRPGRMALKSGQTWPIALRNTDAIRIEYTAGYGAAADVPAPLRRAIRQMAAYLYEHRGDGCSAGDAMSESGAGSAVMRYKVKAI